MCDTVSYKCENDVTIISLNRPHRLNAINLELLRDFMKQLEKARKDLSGVIVIRGEGDSFCSGEDLKETGEGKNFKQWVEEAERLQNIQRILMKMGKPVIAAVSGYALGGGCEFAMGCDIRIADESACFGFPETGVGLTVTNAGTKILTQLIGLGKAKEFVFTGDKIDAVEALRIGLVNKVVPREFLMDEVMTLSHKINKRSPIALRLSKTAIDQGMEASFDQIMELEICHLLIAQHDQDYVKKRLYEMKSAATV